MSHCIKGCLIDCLPNVIILHHGTNDLSSNKCVDDIASRIVALGRFVKNEYNQVYILGLTARNNKWEEKEK